MKLQGILAEYIENVGLYLEDDEDFVYLKHDGEVLAVWHAASASKEDIIKTALKWATVYKREGGKWKQQMNLN